MPTLPLFDTPAHPNGWRRVRAPGGYEWWQFDAEDSTGDRRIVASFHQGSPFDRLYRRRFFQYERRPTRVMPPAPGECIGVEVAVFRGGKVERSFAAKYPAEQFIANADTSALQIGPNRVGEENGTLALWVAGADFSVRLEFRGHLPAAPEREVFAPLSDRTLHRWIIAQPLCDVSGEIRIGGATASFHGRGCHDHHFGTGAIPRGVSRWIRGRVLQAERAAAFHLARVGDVNDVLLLEIDAGGARAVEVHKVNADWGATSPSVLEFDDVLKLVGARRIEVGESRTSVVYDAEWRGMQATAVCEVVKFDGR